MKPPFANPRAYQYISIMNIIGLLVAASRSASGIYSRSKKDQMIHLSGCIVILMSNIYDTVDAKSKSYTLDAEHSHRNCHKGILAAL